MSTSNESTQSWQVRTAEKRSQRDRLIPAAWKLPSALVQGLAHPLEASKVNLIELDIPRRSGILTDKELHITESYDVKGLLKALASGELSSFEVVTAFCKRAAIAQQLASILQTSCLTEVLFEQAQERARHLDALREKGQLLGPLHGLPVSLKDSFQVRGTDATIGFVAFLDNAPSQENSCLVDVLLSLGAVPFCKTNIPQTLMTGDSDNNVFGRTLNPWNTSLTAGGSTGGEGALIAFRGSPLGCGTDVAGSIRIPSLCCGLYGFKPTAGRIPYGKQVSPNNPHLPAIQASAGPLANDLDALEVFLKSVIDARPSLVDSTAIDVPWRTIDPLKSRLRFGVLAEDPLFPWHPPVKTAVADTVDLLRAQGHDVVHLAPEECLSGAGFDLAMQLFSLDKTPGQILAQSNEPLVPSMVLIREAIRGVKFDRDFLPDTRTIEGELEQLSFLNMKRSVFKETWRKVWTERQLDAVIGPGSQNTAVEHDMYGLAPYTGIFNIVDYPACIIPVGQVKSSNSTERFAPSPGQFVPPYNPENLEGAPTAIQIITTRMRDEECLEVARLVDRYVKARAAEGLGASKL